MKIEKELLDDHQVKLTVEMDADLFESAKHRAARQIAKRIKIPGFRPGKAPYGVVLRTVGEGQVVESALEILVEEQYSEVIKQAEITPYGPGKLENVPELEPPTFEFIIPLDAEVILGDYKSIRIPHEIPETTEEDIKKALDEIRERNAVRETVERPAQIGDTVFVRVSGNRMDGEEVSDSIVLEERFSSSVIREEEQQDEFPFPGFSKELIGLNAEDQVKIRHQFPEDYKEEDLQGVEVEYSVVVTNIQSMTLPELDDDFAKEASEYETLEAWKDSLKEELQENAETSYDAEYVDQIMEKIIADSTIKYPPQMVESEANEMLRGLEYRLSQQGMTKELYLQVRGMDEEALFEELKPMAEERLKRDLALFEVSKQEEIEIDQQRVQSETFRTIDAISSQMSPNEAKKLTKSRFIPNLMSNITVDLTTQKTLDFLRAIAKGEPWPPEEESTEEAGESKESEELETEEEAGDVVEESLDSEDTSPVNMEESKTKENDSAAETDEDQASSSDDVQETKEKIDQPAGKTKNNTDEVDANKVESSQQSQEEEEYNA